jgi:type IV pilus biogenesis protein PilP
MKPNFALALSHDGVALLQRSASGWLEVGSTGFDVDDLDAALARLREMASALAPEGISSKLIIPDSELRYVTVLAPGPTDEARLHQIAAQIDGLTPYALDELAFDWAVEGDHAHVAIVARETLAEAEDFARQHRFNPVSFVAQPQGGVFPTEPFLGLTELSATILPAGGRVQPDIDPVRVVGKASLPAKAPASPDALPASPVAPVPAVDTADAPAATPPAPAAPAPVAPRPAPGAAVPAKPAAKPAPVPVPAPVPAPAPAEDASDAGVGGLVRRMGTMLRRQKVSEAPAATKEPEQPPQAGPESPTASQGAFATRRTAPVVVASSPAPVEASPRVGGRLAILPEPAKPKRAAWFAALAFWKPAQTGTPSTTPPARLAPATPGVPAAASDTPKPAVATASSPQPVSEEERKRREAESLTIFGARGASTGNENFARRGLLLTGGLLLVLVALGVWAVYFTASPPSQPAVQPRADAVAQPEAVTRPEPEAEITPDSDPVQVADPEDLLPEDSQLPMDRGDVEAEATSADDIESVAQEALPAETETLVETTQDAAPETTQIVEAPEESLAPETLAETLATETSQVLTLPQAPEQPDLSEVLPEPAAPPPPPGVEFVLGPDGLVEATPDGALTPSGATVFARRPAAVPPPRPAGIAPAAVPDPQGTLQVPIDVQQDQAQLTEDEPAPGQDPALAAFRPAPRPVVNTALAEPEVADAADASEPLTAGALALDALRPVARPETLAAAPAADASPGAPALDLTGATPQAVARSLRPSSRPDDLSESIARALAEQQRLAAAAAARTAAAAPAAAALDPELEEEPDERTVAAAPRIPSSASVAQQATQARVINLRRINLIGVFGTPNDRRALVRLPSGQVVRVQVGDSLDGGRVAAISDTELRYVKNGRNEVLRIGQSG